MSIRFQPKRTEILVSMAKKGMNQSALSEISGVNRTTISKSMNPSKPRPVTATTAKRIARALDCEVESLFDYQIDGVKQEV